MIDFHTHILPSMDDGSKSQEESLNILNELSKENVKLVCLTSHFYARQEDVDTFIERRNKVFKELDYKGDLELRLGSEVHFYRGISINEELDKLCLEKTNLLLLELPFSSPINDTILKEVVSLSAKGYKVVLAHIERYNLKEETIKELKKSSIYIQMNTEYINNFWTRKKALNWLKNGYIDFIGSDCHNLTDRKPEYKKAMDIIEAKLGKDFLVDFNKKASLLLK